MPKPNAHVQTQLEALQDARDRGMVDGYSSNPNVLPECAVKPWKHCTAYEQAYLFGRFLRYLERMDDGL